MANKCQNKKSYVKVRAVSLTNEEHSRYVAHADTYGLKFSEMIRVLFEEDITNEQGAKTIAQHSQRHELRIKRYELLKKLKEATKSSVK